MDDIDPFHFKTPVTKIGIYAQQFKGSARRASGEAEERTHRYVTKPNPEVQQCGNLKCDAYIYGLWDIPLLLWKNPYFIESVTTLLAFKELNQRYSHG